MRFLLSILLLCLAIPAQAALNRDTLIDAIGQVETGGRAGLVGKQHERGIYQMLPSVAREMSGYDKAAALRWLDRLIRRLEARHVDVTPYTLSLCWNAGFRATVEGRAPEVSYTYANRVTSLYQSRLPIALSKPTHPRFIIP